MDLFWGDSEIVDLRDTKTISLEKVIDKIKPESLQKLFFLDEIIDKMTIETRKLENKEINKNNLKVIKIEIEENIKNMIESLNFVMKEANKEKIKFTGSDLQTEEAIKVSLRKNMLRRIGNLITRQAVLLEEEGMNYKDINWPKNTVSTLKQLLISGVLVSAVVISIITAIVTALIQFK